MPTFTRDDYWKLRRLGPTSGTPGATGATGPAGPAAGFPLVYDDGTYTYEITATGSFLLKQNQDVDPTISNFIEMFTPASMSIHAEDDGASIDILAGDAPGTGNVGIVDIYGDASEAHVWLTVNTGTKNAKIATEVSDSGGYSRINLSIGGVINATVDSTGLLIPTAGKGLSIKEGSNAKMGTATLVTGTKVVSTTAVTANSRIFLTVQSLGTVAVPKAIGVTARTAGTSFTITSADATDTSVVAWLIMEPA